jgi:hypothetical protein
MKTLLRKKWFRRLCQTLLALCSLLVLAYVFIDWRGARMKRDVIAEIRAAGRPTSIAEMLKPLPRDEDNFAMIPILAQAREEWWNDTSNRIGHSPGQAKVKLDSMTFKSGKKAFPREGKPDLSIWKKNFDLSGSDAECLEAYDRKFGDILTELRAGMSRPEMGSPLFHLLAARSDTDWLGMTSGYVIDLAKVAESLGFRAELALAAGRPEVAHESLSMAIRLSKLTGSEGTLIGQLLQGRVIRHLQPTFARALQTAGWDKARITSLRNEIAGLNVLDGFRRALDVENFASFAMFEEMKRHPEYIAGDSLMGAADWNPEFSYQLIAKLPLGWFQGTAAFRSQQGLQLRKDLGEGVDLQSWYQACVRAAKRGESNGNRTSWMHPLREDLDKLFGQAFQRACGDQTLIQHALLACDLETYRLDHGRYPERLQNSGSPAIIDSMTGQPFVYRITTDSRYLLYSVGADATDDGGKRSKQDFYAKKDWVW